ncbi:unnamed protein product [Auanema sp. JU1783]|nr:unnamed protein product [Auanema sp. JU1783]
MPETENFHSIVRNKEKVASRVPHAVGSPLKENFKNGEALHKQIPDESLQKNAKKDKSGNENSKRFRVIMECELHIGTLCIFDAEEYWTTEMINKIGCPHRGEASNKYKKSL